ncbi:MAG: hypothetical protein M3541_17385 [Acidobacteriota bacterium]|nr:hypothetical protein [Acidobacteriota bacterium]MDQ3420517.1 hypothetical protein [Acidobacteriota bacterium]
MRPSVSLRFAVLTSFLLSGCANGSSVNEVTGPAVSSSSFRTLVDLTTGLEVTSGQVGTFNWVGQSFVVPETGSFGDLRFHFYDYQKAPVAFGNLYLLTQEYLGVPAGLNSSVPGLVGRSESTSGGLYTFAAGTVITGGTKYWVYTDAQGSFAGSFDTDIITGGDMYVTGFPTNPFRKAQASGRMVNGVFVPAPAGVFVDANFKLQARAR